MSQILCEKCGKLWIYWGPHPIPAICNACKSAELNKINETYKIVNNHGEDSKIRVFNTATKKLNF